MKGRPERPARTPSARPSSLLVQVPSVARGPDRLARPRRWSPPSSSSCPPTPSSTSSTRSTGPAQDRPAAAVLEHLPHALRLHPPDPVRRAVGALLRGAHRPARASSATATPWTSACSPRRTSRTANILVQAIPIGGLRMLDGNEADDKIVAVLQRRRRVRELARHLGLPAAAARPPAPLLPDLQAVARPARDALRDHARLRPRGGPRGDPAQPRRLPPALRRPASWIRAIALPLRREPWPRRRISAERPRARPQRRSSRRGTSR